MQQHNVNTESDIDNILILYTLSTSEIISNNDMLHIQIYPGGYDDVSILFEGYKQKQFKKYSLGSASTSFSPFEVVENDVLTMYMASNSYISAGGIWQVDVLSEESPTTLKCICSTSIDLVEVNELLSAEELTLIDHEIKQVYTFLLKRFRLAKLVSCCQIDKGIWEQLRQMVPVHPDIKGDEHVWQMLWNCNPVPWTMCRLVVSSHPQTSDLPFTVEIAEQWVQTWES